MAQEDTMLRAEDGGVRARRFGIIGVGGGGINIMAAVARELGDGLVTAAVDTDSRSLEAAAASVKLYLGSRHALGLGTGGDPQLGRIVAEEDEDLIRELCAKMDIAFVVAGLGGGTGTGVLPVVLKAARAAGITTLCFVTLPFPFEGHERRSIAEPAVGAITDTTDALVMVPNERIVDLVGGGTVVDAYRTSDALMGMGISALWQLITRPGYNSLSMVDLKRLFVNAGACTFAYGEGTGMRKTEDAVNALFSSPLLGSPDALQAVSNPLVGIICGPDLSVKEINEIMGAVRAKFRPGTHVSTGTVIDDAQSGRLTLVLVVSVEPSGGRSGEQLREEDALPEIGAKSRKKKTRGTQGTLALGDDPATGRFGSTEATVEDGENLDIPTYMRKGIPLDK